MMESGLETKTIFHAVCPSSLQEAGKRQFEVFISLVDWLFPLKSSGTKLPWLLCSPGPKAQFLDGYFAFAAVSVALGAPPGPRCI